MAFKPIVRWVIMWNDMSPLTQVISIEYLPRATKTQTLATKISPILYLGQ
jgi:hypothetical protein